MTDTFSLPTSYHKQNACVNCTNVAIVRITDGYYESRDCYCTIDLSPEQRAEFSQLVGNWNDWRRIHRVAEYGICNQWEGDE